MSDDTSLTARLRSAVARLAPSQDGDASPQARDEKPIAIGRQEHTEEPDKGEIEEYRDEYYANPLLRQPVRNFAADVCEPGYRVNVDAGEGDEPTVPSDYRFAEFRGMDLSDALEAWLEQAAIIGGRFDRDFSDLLEDLVIDLRGRRGTALVEHAYDDPREREYILGLRAFKVETTTAYTRDGKRILLRPDDTDVDFETIAVQDIAGDPTRFDTAPSTPAEKAAALVQFDDILGSYDEKDDIPFALDDVTLISNDPDTGAIFGKPDTASVTDRSAELREMFKDTARAVKAVGYGHWIAQVDTDDEDEARKLLDSFDPTDPESVDVVNYAVETEQFDSDVPSNVDHIQQQIEYILAALPTPLYRVGFAGDINRDVTSVQQDDYREEVSRERDRLESAFHDLLVQKAREFLFDDAKADEALDVDVELVIEPEEAASPLEDENVDADEFSALMQGLKAAAPGGAVEQVVPAHEIRETFLGLEAEPPEAPDAEGGIDSAAALPDETDPEVRESFRNAYDARLSGTGANAGQWDADDVLQAILNWNPALHPRNPETGKFVERPYDVPDEISGLDTRQLIGELAAANGGFAEQVEDIAVDLPSDDDGGSAVPTRIRDVIDDPDAGSGGSVDGIESIEDTSNIEAGDMIRVGGKLVEVTGRSSTLTGETIDGEKAADGSGVRIQPSADITTPGPTATGSEYFNEEGFSGHAEMTRLVSTEYGPKVKVDSPYEAKEAVKSLDWDETHRSWNSETKTWDVDLDAADQVVEVLADEGYEVEVSHDVIQASDLSSPS